MSQHHSRHVSLYYPTLLFLLFSGAFIASVFIATGANIVQSGASVPSGRLMPLLPVRSTSCQWQGENASKPPHVGGTGPSACTTPASQIQGVQVTSSGGGGNGIYVGNGPQCAGATPPPAARAAGLTKLQFCDDFSDPSTFDFKGTGNPGFKWYRTNGIFSLNKAGVIEPESSFTIQGGVMEQLTTNGHYASNMQSAIVKNGQPVGYYIDREVNGWYVEAALAHPVNVTGLGFWSMDMCHTYQYPQGCVRYAEPDWYEYWNSREVHATHMWITPDGGGGHGYKDQPDCKNSWAHVVDPSQFHTYGVLTTSAGVTYFRDNGRVAACDTMPWKSEIVAGPSSEGDQVGRYPILIGTKYPGQSMKIDFVRVWVKP